ncbi:MAG: iron-containing alcohol dehydrogenase [Lachnospiraceae bacterium]|nr:iron-containing alcohol dehydrogenase [Lachnospiraceae bacterium]
MNPFVYYAPTKICFGKGQISHLSELKESGSRALLVYGGGSIKRQGIYDEAVRILTEAGITITELSGIEPNPRVESVRRGIALCREHRIEMVLGIGGGSVIDAAKAIAGGACYDGDVWDLVMDHSLIRAALPIYAVVTMAATGSEMNKNAVISDLGLRVKKSMGSDLLKPRLSICDPVYTFSVPEKQTAAGTADIMSHAFENYFSMIDDFDLSARFGEAVIRCCIRYGPVALREPDNYEARANLMWASTNAINGITKAGMEVGWSCHPMEHELSAFYDITHGVGLAILTPRWMEYVLNDKTVRKFADYGRKVWDLTGTEDLAVAKEAIDKTASFFFDTLKLPRTLRDVGIGEENFEAMAEHCAPRLADAFVPLTKEDAVQIYRNCLS